MADKKPPYRFSQEDPIFKLILRAYQIGKQHELEQKQKAKAEQDHAAKEKQQ